MDDNPNKIATVVLPEGGQSYNPSLQVNFFMIKEFLIKHYKI